MKMTITANGWLGSLKTRWGHDSKEKPKRRSDFHRLQQSNRKLHSDPQTEQALAEFLGTANLQISEHARNQSDLTTQSGKSRSRTHRSAYIQNESHRVTKRNSVLGRNREVAISPMDDSERPQMSRSHVAVISPRKNSGRLRGLSKLSASSAITHWPGHSREESAAEIGDSTRLSSLSDVAYNTHSAKSSKSANGKLLETLGQLADEDDDKFPVDYNYEPRNVGKHNAYGKSIASIASDGLPQMSKAFRGMFGEDRPSREPLPDLPPLDNLRISYMNNSPVFSNDEMAASYRCHRAYEHGCLPFSPQEQSEAELPRLDVQDESYQKPSFGTQEDTVALERYAAAFNSLGDLQKIQEDLQQSQRDFQTRLHPDHAFDRKRLMGSRSMPLMASSTMDLEGGYDGEQDMFHGSNRLGSRQKMPSLENLSTKERREQAHQLSHSTHPSEQGSFVASIIDPVVRDLALAKRRLRGHQKTPPIHPSQRRSLVGSEVDFFASPPAALRSTVEGNSSMQEDGSEARADAVEVEGHRSRELSHPTIPIDRRSLNLQGRKSNKGNRGCRGTSSPQEPKSTRRDADVIRAPRPTLNPEFRFPMPPRNKDIYELEAEPVSRGAVQDYDRYIPFVSSEQTLASEPDEQPESEIPGQSKKEVSWESSEIPVDSKEMTSREPSGGSVDSRKTMTRELSEEPVDITKVTSREPSEEPVKITKRTNRQTGAPAQQGRSKIAAPTTRTGGRGRAVQQRIAARRDTPRATGNQRRAAAGKNNSSTRSFQKETPRVPDNNWNLIVGKNNSSTARVQHSAGESVKPNSRPKNTSGIPSFPGDGTRIPSFRGEGSARVYTPHDHPRRSRNPVKKPAILNVKVSEKSRSTAAENQAVPTDEDALMKMAEAVVFQNIEHLIVDVKESPEVHTPTSQHSESIADPEEVRFVELEEAQKSLAEINEKPIIPRIETTPASEERHQQSIQDKGIDARMTPRRKDTTSSPEIPLRPQRPTVWKYSELPDTSPPKKKPSEDRGLPPPAMVGRTMKENLPLANDHRSDKSSEIMSMIRMTPRNGQAKSVASIHDQGGEWNISDGSDDPFLKDVWKSSTPAPSRSNDSNQDNRLSVIRKGPADMSDRARETSRTFASMMSAAEGSDRQIRYGTIRRFGHGHPDRSWHLLEVDELYTDEASGKTFAAIRGWDHSEQTPKQHHSAVAARGSRVPAQAFNDSSFENVARVEKKTVSAGNSSLIPSQLSIETFSAFNSKDIEEEEEIRLGTVKLDESTFQFTLKKTATADKRKQRENLRQRQSVLMVPETRTGNETHTILRHRSYTKDPVDEPIRDNISAHKSRRAYVESVRSPPTENAFISPGGHSQNSEDDADDEDNEVEEVRRGRSRFRMLRPMPMAHSPMRSLRGRYAEDEKTIMGIERSDGERRAVASHGYISDDQGRLLKKNPSDESLFAAIGQRDRPVDDANRPRGKRSLEWNGYRMEPVEDVHRPGEAGRHPPREYGRNERGVMRGNSSKSASLNFGQLPNQALQPQPPTKRQLKRILPVLKKAKTLSNMAGNSKASEGGMNKAVVESMLNVEAQQGIKRSRSFWDVLKSTTSKQREEMAAERQRKLELATDELHQLKAGYLAAESEYIDLSEILKYARRDLERSKERDGDYARECAAICRKHGFSTQDLELKFTDRGDEEDKLNRFEVFYLRFRNYGGPNSREIGDLKLPVLRQQIPRL